jgi:hypothetical protein
LNLLISRLQVRFLCGSPGNPSELASFFLTKVYYYSFAASSTARIFTFFNVVHDQIETMSMGDRIVTMKDGLVQQVGTPQNLYEKPDNVFVNDFVSSSQQTDFMGVLAGLALNMM